MSRQVLSHDWFFRKLSTSLSHFRLSVAFISCSMERIKPSTEPLMWTRFLIPYGFMTSCIGVETTGTPAARYSGVLVGLIKRVDSFKAKGISATSQPDR